MRGGGKKEEQKRENGKRRKRLKSPRGLEIDQGLRGLLGWGVDDCSDSQVNVRCISVMKACVKNNNKNDYDC